MNTFKVGDIVRFVNIGTVERFAFHTEEKYYKPFGGGPAIVPSMLPYLNNKIITKVKRILNEKSCEVEADNGAWTWPSFCFERVDSKNLEIE